MTTYQEILKLEIQKSKEETRILSRMLATSLASPAPGASDARQHHGSGKYPNKSMPHYVKRGNAEEAFRKMPGCAYNWLRNFLAEELVVQGPKLGNFSARTWTKTEKGLTSRWHDRTVHAQPVAI